MLSVQTSFWRFVVTFLRYFGRSVFVRFAKLLCRDLNVGEMHFVVGSYYRLILLCSIKLMILMSGYLFLYLLQRRLYTLLTFFFLIDFVLWFKPWVWCFFVFISGKHFLLFKVVYHRGNVKAKLGGWLAFLNNVFILYKFSGWIRFHVFYNGVHIDRLPHIYRLIHLIGCSYFERGVFNYQVFVIP